MPDPRSLRFSTRLRHPNTPAVKIVVAFALIACMFCSVSCMTTRAADRSEARLRRLLLGRHDNARVAAIASVSSDFQTRLAALPVVIESLDALSEDPRFTKAVKQGQPELPDGIRSMIDFIGSVDRPDAADALTRQLDSGRVTWMMATVQTLGKYRHHSAIDRIAALIESEAFDNHYGLRFVIARGLKDMRHPDAWDALAKLVNRIDGQLAHLLDEEFQHVTAAEFGDDEQRYRLWRGSVGLAPDQEPEAEDPLRAAAKLVEQADSDAMPMPKKMGLSPSKSAASYARNRRLTPSQYYGIDIFARRLLFVIDRSGSMATLVSNGHTRIQNAQHELITAISGLDEQCEFGILVFDSDVREWKNELVAATEENKRSAIRFVEYLSAGNKTNTYGALRRSLDFDEQLESVFLLTDGRPTTGLVVNPSTILMDILRRNEINNVTFNVIAIGVEPITSTFLRNLTEPSSGEFREVK